MKHIIAIFIRDLKRIGKNPIAIVVAAGIMVLPSLYAWFNIAANWDPYGSTRGLKVAVANLDEGLSIGGPDANIGEMILDNLRKNEQIGWQFVDKDKAMAGVEDGSYYAAVIIPADFSSKISSILTNDVERPSIQYYVNEKRNAIATKITDKGVGAIQQQVNETFISATSEVLGKILNESSSEMDDRKISLANEIIDTLSNTREDLESLSSSVSVFRETLLAVKDLTEGIKNTLPNADKLLADGQKTSDDVQGLITSSQDMSDTVVDSIEQILNSAAYLQESLDSEFEYLNRAVERDSNSVVKILTDIEKQADSMINFNHDLSQSLKNINNKLPIPVKSLNNIIEKLEESEQKEIILKNKVKELERSVANTGTLPQEAKDDLEAVYLETKNSVGDVRDFYRANVQQQLKDSLDQVYISLSSVSLILMDVQNTLPMVDTALTSAGSSFEHQIEALTHASEVLDKGTSKIDNMIESVNQVSDNEKLAKLLEILQNDPKVVSSFLASPVALEVNKVYPIENYGSAMTPFYTILAIWVGGLVLVAVLKCKVQEDEQLHHLKPWEIYFGRYLTFMLFGIVQALIVSLGDLYLLKIQCVNRGLFVLAAVIASIIFTNIIYTLTISFGDVGKAIAVVLLVIQVAGAGGTFPIEVTPHFFQAVNPLLPFTHMINAMRECVAGIYKNAYVTDIMKVIIYLPISLFIGTVLRKPLIRFNEYMEDELEETGIM